MAIKYQVIGTYTIWIRSQYASGANIGLLRGGDIIEALEIKGNWVKHNKIGKIGWSVMVERGKPLMKLIESTPVTTSTPPPPAPKPEETEFEPIDYAKLQAELNAASEQNINNFIKDVRVYMDYHINLWNLLIEELLVVNLVENMQKRLLQICHYY